LIKAIAMRDFNFSYQELEQISFVELLLIVASYNNYIVDTEKQQIKSKEKKEWEPSSQFKAFLNRLKQMNPLNQA
jgi:hypothetical protein